MAGGFGARFNAATRRQLRAKATPSSGSAPEAIWAQFYDTQTYVDNVTTTLTFFQTTNVDPTITNMQAAGQFPDPQWFSIYDICLDFNTQNTSDAAAVVGEYNDLSLLLKVGRPIWVLTISDKRYGPYSVRALHAIGGPVGGVDAGTLAVAAQWANNVFSPGWNYHGTIVIPPKTNFNIELRWSAAQDLTGNVPIQLSMFGILSRRTL